LDRPGDHPRARVHVDRVDVEVGRKAEKRALRNRIWMICVTIGPPSWKCPSLRTGFNNCKMQRMVDDTRSLLLDRLVALASPDPI
jgi:hypothetical protein